MKDAPIKSPYVKLDKGYLTPQEVLELQEINRVVSARVWEYHQLKANTALLPTVKLFGFTLSSGKHLVEQAKAAASILEGAKRHWIGQKLIACGYPANTLCDINLSTGRITPHGPAKPAKLKQLPEFKAVVRFIAAETAKLDTLDDLETLSHDERAKEVSARIAAHATLCAILGPLLADVDKPIGVNPNDYVI